MTVNTRRKMWLCAAVAASGFVLSAAASGGALITWGLM